MILILENKHAYGAKLLFLRGRKGHFAKQNDPCGPLKKISSRSGVNLALYFHSENCWCFINIGAIYKNIDVI